MFEINCISFFTNKLKETQGMLFTVHLHWIYCTVVEHHQAVCTFGQEKMRGWRWLPKQSEILWDYLSCSHSKGLNSGSSALLRFRKGFPPGTSCWVRSNLSPKLSHLYQLTGNRELGLLVPCPCDPLCKGYYQKADTPTFWHKCCITDATALNSVGRSIPVLKGPWEQSICAQIAGRPEYILRHNVSENAQLTCYISHK